MKTYLDEEACKQGAPLRTMITAEEARLMKGVLNRLEVRLWNGDTPWIDRLDPYGNWVIYIPSSEGISTHPWQFISSVPPTDDTSGHIFGIVKAGLALVQWDIYKCFIETTDVDPNQKYIGGITESTDKEGYIAIEVSEDNRFFWIEFSIDGTDITATWKSGGIIPATGLGFPKGTQGMFPSTPAIYNVPILEFPWLEEDLEADPPVEGRITGCVEHMQSDVHLPRL